jgi:hypothetical protein
MAWYRVECWYEKTSRWPIITTKKWVTETVVVELQEGFTGTKLLETVKWKLDHGNRYATWDPEIQGMSGPCATKAEAHLAPLERR